MLLKKAWICASDIVPAFVKTASLMMLPASKPASVDFTIPAETGSTAAFAMLALLEPLAETDAVAAVAGTHRSDDKGGDSEETGEESGEPSCLFRERGARRDM